MSEDEAGMLVVGLRVSKYVGVLMRFKWYTLGVGVCVLGWR